MKIVLSAILICLFSMTFETLAQSRPVVKRSAVTTSKPREIGQTAVVMDETLSVLRQKPSLFAEPIQRMRRGRQVRILGVTEADGVKFYRVAALPSGSGWVQADSIFGRFREGDDARLAKLVQSNSALRSSSDSLTRSRPPLSSSLSIQRRSFAQLCCCSLGIFWRRRLQNFQRTLRRGWIDARWPPRPLHSTAII